MISVIIPVYNVEEYLPQCLDSMLAQTCTDWEAILVDDGSTDASPAICDDYAAKDARFRVMHRENGGVSAARNAALDAARGEYITFLDSDDLLLPGALAHLHNLCITHGADMSVGTFLHLNEDGSTQPCRNRAFIHGTEILNGTDKMVSLLGKNQQTDAVWGKLYRRELFGDVRFPVGVTRSEDVSVSYRLVHAARRIVIDENPQYLYRNRAGSVMNRECISIRDFDSLNIRIQERQFVSDHYPQLREAAETLSCYTALKLVVRSAMTGFHVPQIDRQMQRELRRTVGSFLRSRHSRNRKAVALLAAAHIGLARAFVRRVKMGE